MLKTRNFLFWSEGQKKNTCWTMNIVSGPFAYVIYNFPVEYLAKYYTRF